MQRHTSFNIFHKRIGRMFRTIVFSAGSPVTNRARDFVCAFVQTLKEQSTITEHLPFYAQELPYYRRMLAAAMSRSLEKSLPPEGDQISSLLASNDPLMVLTQ